MEQGMNNLSQSQDQEYNPLAYCLSTQNMARHLDLAPKTLHNWLCEGKVKLGQHVSKVGRLRWIRTEMERFVREGRA